MDARVVNDKPNISNSVFCKLELGRIEDDPLAGAFGQKLTDSGEVGSNVCIPENRVVNALFLINKILSNDLVHPLAVSIPGRDEALGSPGPIILL